MDTGIVVDILIVVGVVLIVVVVVVMTEIVNIYYDNSKHDFLSIYIYIILSELLLLWYT